MRDDCDVKFTRLEFVLQTRLETETVSQLSHSQTGANTGRDTFPPVRQSAGKDDINDAINNTKANSQTFTTSIIRQMKSGIVIQFSRSIEYIFIAGFKFNNNLIISLY